MKSPQKHLMGQSCESTTDKELAKMGCDLGLCWDGFHQYS